jgi:hypothetical protein
MVKRIELRWYIAWVCGEDNHELVQEASQLDVLIEHSTCFLNSIINSSYFRICWAASHNWWKFGLAISYTPLSSQSIPLSNQCFLYEFQPDWFLLQRL